MDFRDILMTAATQGGGGAAGPAELLVNTTFADGSNWTLAGNINIGSSKLNITGGGTKTCVQTLVGGSVAAGNYTVGIDVDSTNAAFITIQLLGAANEIRGQQTSIGAGAGQTFVVAATDEVSKFRVLASAAITAAVMDNVSMKAAP